MGRILFLCSVLVMFISVQLFSSNVLGLEKVNFGTGIKIAPAYYLPMMAGEEKGFWKQNNLNVNWIPFRGGVNMNRGLVSKAIDAGFTMVAPTLLGIAAGVPAVIIAELTPVEEFNIWVRPDSRIRAPRDLAGAKIGVSRMGGVSHAYGMMVVRSLGLKGKVRFIGVGRSTASFGSLKAGVVNAIVSAFLVRAELKNKGELRDILKVQDYVPKPWSENIVIAHSQVIRDRRATVARLIKAINQATVFVTNNRAWAEQKLKSFSGYSQATAKMVFQRMKFTPGGKVNEKGLENVLNFMVEFGVLAKDRKPQLQKVYTEEFTE